MKCEVTGPLGRLRNGIVLKDSVGNVVPMIDKSILNEIFNIQFKID